MSNETEYDFLTKFALENKELFSTAKSKSIFDGSPLEFLVEMQSPHDRGKFAMEFVRSLAAVLGFATDKNGWILSIRGHNVAVKFSRQGEDGGFVINQIRDQDYEYIVNVVALPDPLVTLFVIPKDYIMSITRGQHGGSDSKETHIYTASDLDQMRIDFPGMEGVERFKEVFSQPVYGIKIPEPKEPSSPFLN